MSDKKNEKTLHGVMSGSSGAPPFAINYTGLRWYRQPMRIRMPVWRRLRWGNSPSQADEAHGTPHAAFSLCGCARRRFHGFSKRLFPLLYRPRRNFSSNTPRRFSSWRSCLWNKGGKTDGSPWASELFLIFPLAESDRAYALCLNRWVLLCL